MLSQSSASLFGGASAAGAPLTPEERALEDAWRKQRQRLGVREPIDLIHRALAQREGAASLDALEGQTEARLAELLEEGEQLGKRRERAASATSLAAGKRLERLHDLVDAAEKELAKGTGGLQVSDALIGEARLGIAALDALAVEATAHAGAAGPTYERRADPRECDSAALPSLMEAAVEAVVGALRAAEALHAMREAREALAADVDEEAQQGQVEPPASDGQQVVEADAPAAAPPAREMMPSSSVDARAGDDELKSAGVVVRG